MGCREGASQASRVGTVGCKGIPSREAPMSKGADTSWGRGGTCKNHGCVISLCQGYMRCSQTRSSTTHAGSALMA